ncbi:MAG TPA: ATP-dependent DNA ligase [Candidatus Bathyarchaeia archaeon]|nr:ATP-dependent DNA ligase [Candidatus Bathyarchaeia archaeon]
MKDPTRFLELAQLCRSVEATTKRTEKVRLISEFLKKLETDEISKATLFLAGKAFPEADPRVLEISYATLSEAGKRLSQTTLIEQPLTINQIYSTFERIAEASGGKSRERKLALLQTLMGKASPIEAEFLTRMMLGEMRIGSVEGVLLDSISAASGVSRELVRRAHMLHGDIGDVARRAITQGPSSLEQIGLRLFVPVKPMLAENADTIQDVLSEHVEGSAWEYKFDGARFQIHRKGDQVRVYSRRLTDVTDSLPELVDFARTKMNAAEFLVEGEVFGTGAGGKPIPFQDLMRRFRRVHEIKEMTGKIPLRLYLFDVLEVDGKTLIDLPYTARWDTLSKLTPREYLAPRIITKDPAKVEEFFQAAVKEGHEGLMAKSLSSNYSIGARGKKWFKLKRADHLDVVIVAAEWGSGRRVGWLSNYHLAVRDEDTGDFLVIGKTFKGLTDSEFDTITQRLQELKTHENRHVVYVKPAIVAEVAYNEVQKSPIYKSGFALRFARITRFREDKSPEDGDTIGRLRQLYDKQFQQKARFEQ